MKNTSSLEDRKSAARGLNILAAAGVILVLATAATALTFAGNNSQDEVSIVPTKVN